MEEKCMGLKNEVALQEKQTGDVDRQLDETTRELHREREKLMAVIRMSGDLIFEYDIVNDKMYYAGPGVSASSCSIADAFTIIASQFMAIKSVGVSAM